MIEVFHKCSFTRPEYQTIVYYLMMMCRMSEAWTACEGGAMTDGRSGHSSLSLCLSPPDSGISHSHAWFSYYNVNTGPDIFRRPSLGKQFMFPIYNSVAVKQKTTSFRFHRDVVKDI